MSYVDLLKRGRSQVPDKVKGDIRFEMPKAETLDEGKATVIPNFKQICDALRRDPEHVLKWLQRELGAPCVNSGGRAIIQRKLGRNAVNEKMEEYLREYVLCNECGKPDTHFEKDHRVHILRCEACGGHRPLKSG